MEEKVYIRILDKREKLKFINEKIERKTRS